MYIDRCDDASQTSMIHLSAAWAVTGILCPWEARSRLLVLPCINRVHGVPISDTRSGPRQSILIIYILFSQSKGAEEGDT